MPMSASPPRRTPTRPPDTTRLAHPVAGPGVPRSTASGWGTAPEQATLIVVKLDARHRVRLSYPAEVVARRPNGVVVRAP